MAKMKAHIYQRGSGKSINQSMCRENESANEMAMEKNKKKKKKKKKNKSGENGQWRNQ
jgi:hypothetical protein